MGAIYKNAAETCIWLGPRHRNSARAMDIIRNLDGENLESPRHSPDPDGLQAIADLQKRSWWTRVWIIQEALLSPNPTVHCPGATPLPMDKFMVLDDPRRGWHRSSEQEIYGVQNAISRFPPQCATFLAASSPTGLMPGLGFSPQLQRWCRTRAPCQDGRSISLILRRPIQETGFTGSWVSAPRRIGTSCAPALERNLSVGQVYTIVMC